MDILDALGAASYAAHSICLTNDPWIIGLYTWANLVTALSYIAIAAINAVTRGYLAGPSYVGFSLFIALCGLTHLSGVAVIYAGVYRLDVVAHMLTAGISASTAVYVARGWLKWRRLTPT